MLNHIHVKFYILRYNGCINAAFAVVTLVIVSIYMLLFFYIFRLYV